MLQVFLQSHTICCDTFLLNNIKYLHALLSALWVHRGSHVPEFWKVRFLCPIPKGDLASTKWGDLRPLMLLDCLRKFWTEFLIKTLTDTLQKNNFLAPSQLSTTGCILQFITASEEAAETSSSFCGLGLQNSFRLSYSTP